MIGKNILNYEIKSLLGEGGMGNVYTAEHTQLGRKVAVKSLHQQLVKNESLRARFKNEASTMALLQHPKIVALYDYVEEADGLYLVMEYVEGLPLDEYIKEKSGPIPSETAIPMMIQILDAFSYAHSKGIVHRDIKPSNIIITNNGEIKILDFGIAKMMSEAGNKLTKTGTQMGTVFYMSPEQVQGKDIDIRSDIYSLGVTFYQMLTGISPYDGMTTEFEVYSKIVAEPLPNASSLYPGVPDFLDKVILKATAKNKEERFQNCEDFSSDLSKRESPKTASKTVVQAVNPANSHIPNQGPISGGIDYQAKKSKAPLIALIVIVVLVGIIRLAVGGLNNSSSSSDDDYIDSDAAVPTEVAPEPEAYVEETAPATTEAAPAVPEASAENKIVEFQNNYGYTMYLAYAYYDNSWKTVGWKRISPGEWATITLPNTFNSNEIYWYASDLDGFELEGYDDGTNLSRFCIYTADDFFFDSYDPNCNQSKIFTKLSVVNNYSYEYIGSSAANK